MVNNHPLPVQPKPKWVFQFLLVALLGLALLAVTYIVAPGVAQQQPTIARLLSNVTYERTFLAAAVCIFLLIPTYWLFLLQHRQGPTTLWRAFWTMSYVAYATHLYWSIQLLLQEQGMATNVWTWETLKRAIFHSPDLLSSPRFDTLLTVWWTLDVVIAWLPGKLNGLGTVPPVSLRDKTPHVEPFSDSFSFVRWERSLLHLILYVAWIVASIPQGHGLVRVLGYLFAIATLLALVARVLLRQFYAESLSGKLYMGTFSLLNRFFKWYELPTWFGVINMGALREVLRAKNLHGTDQIPVTNPSGLIDNGKDPLPHPRDLVKRRDDGCYNDLEKPSMGRGSKTTDPSGDSMLHNHSHPCARFGRNVPLKDAFPDEKNLLTPNPRRISRELLSREKFIPATTLNLIAAAWIQFQTHDWFNHGEPDHANNIKVPLPEGDSWSQGNMLVGRTRPDPTRDYERERQQSPDGKLQYPPTYVNAESHWWDASQIYGNDSQACRTLRTDPNTKQLVPKGKLYIDAEGNIPYDPSDPQGLAISGFVGNWWLGLRLLHALFVKEHNAICDRLAQLYPFFSDDELFAKARMINSVLIAKIHTVEWTPAILQNPALQIGMKANWWGLFTENFTKTFGRISPTEAFSGIPDSGVDHHKVDFTLTEEFVSVYRLHPLMPDKLEIFNIQDGHSLQTFDLTEKNGIEGIIGAQRDLIHLGHKRVKMPATMTEREWQNNLWYSFGKANPGAITLHNYPNYMRDLTHETPGETRPDGKREVNIETIDLATIDILRDRERGVPRYNRFRELFHLKPIESFDEFKNSPHQGLPEKLRAIYGQTNGKDNVDALDLMVGMFAEVPPEGFGFSDTAFRVFILMASRRIKSDRFMAEGFNANVFTREGIEWVNENSMLSILRRHHPELAPALYGLENAFVPWHDLLTH
ncbi:MULTISPECIES: peroxidase family protein [unclassified Nostoc]|uniref:peroxidase family protein n=1 Tax=unclassified Nostoc TaxID=2593658 RepID=UPI002AD51005|nr:peroxidase family protein [Nostoc sp. DedQUE03]MDZ7971698.1 peroxidase family protein [Nostoc sp. DedQUE03]MDZ8046568.1 peroxidase family protein [Nostoc sp. DedQUE02]